MITDAFILFLSLVLIFYLSDLLTRSLSMFAKKLRINSFFLGTMLLALGTSFPELISATTAGILKVNQLSIGNLIGSNIVNTLLIIGVMALIRPIRNIRKGEIKETIPIILSTILVLIFLMNGYLSRTEGIILIISYFAYHYFMHKSKFFEGKIITKARIAKEMIVTPFTIFGIIISGYLVVSSSVFLAKSYGINLTLFGLTVVAIGTSMPELATSIASSKNNNSKLGIGNIIGSNITNVLLILGITSVINPINFTINTFILVSWLFFFLSSLVLSIMMINDKKISKNEGIFLLMSFVIYLTLIVMTR